ncbi:hypothetical protein ACH5RR_024366 [Cinchona calisaya]|uniref:Hydroxyproline-rich glycoprotein family protein n=1 Tax=Cinchona calisaya TaxID=153742 RepID=A0ABD2YWE9_9GENT
MEEDGEDLTPFWLQTTTNHGRGRRFLHGLSSFFFSSGLLVSILLVTAVSFLVFVVPSTISFSTQIFRPNNVKKSWDSLNLVLVLFALVFGFLSRNKNEDHQSSTTTTTSSTRTETQKSNPSTPHLQQGWYNYSSIPAEKSNPSNPVEWYGYSDQTAYNTSSMRRGGLMRRTSSSYPDLLEATPRLISGDDDPWRSYDDMNIDTPRYSDSGQLYRRRSWKYYTFDDSSQLESKNLYVDRLVNQPPKEPSYPLAPAPPSSPPPAASPAQPSPPPVSPALPPASPPLQNEKPIGTHQSVAHRRERRRKRKDNQLEHQEPISEPATPPPPPPPPPPPLPQFVDQKSGKSEKKRTGATATKDFLNSLYHKKKKKQRQKSVENFDALLHEPEIPPLHFQIPPTSPTPPPSVFHNLFSSKKSKRKTTHTVISVPIPPPTASAISKTSQFEFGAARRPQQPIKVRSFGSEEGNSNSGGESPLIPIPPPPPPPPSFKSPAWKFVLQGDYVRVNSNLSSRSGSPDPDEVESDGTPTAADGGEASPFPPSPLFCPSPDVDAKAAYFISKFRAGLKLEKIDSMNKKQGVGLSNLGPGSGPTHI